MSEINPAENSMVEQIRAGSETAWNDLVARYQGRLVAFARGKLPQRADAEDVVQETFIGFLRGLERFRGESSLETYLFTILRRNIVNTYRTGRSRKLCLLQDVYKPDQDEGSDAFDRVAAADLTASHYVRREEQMALIRDRLTASLGAMVNRLKEELNFRDLELVELLFYCQLANKDIARVSGINEKNIAVIKHRCLKALRERVQGDNLGDLGEAELENLLTPIWEAQRFSCPKRSTIGAYLLGTLEPDWQDYVHFHVEKLGCRFCRANLQDLQEQNSAAAEPLRARIMESTVGFLHKS